MRNSMKYVERDEDPNDNGAKFHPERELPSHNS